MIAFVNNRFFDNVRVMHRSGRKYVSVQSGDGNPLGFTANDGGHRRYFIYPVLPHRCHYRSHGNIYETELDAVSGYLYILMGALHRDFGYPAAEPDVYGSYQKALEEFYAYIQTDESPLEIIRKTVSGRIIRMDDAGEPSNEPYIYGVYWKETGTYTDAYGMPL